MMYSHRSMEQYCKKRVLLTYIVHLFDRYNKWCYILTNDGMLVPQQGLFSMELIM
jgi:hypothetical protein